MTALPGMIVEPPSYAEVMEALVRLHNCMADEDMMKLRLNTVEAKLAAGEVIMRHFGACKAGWNA